MSASLPVAVSSLEVLWTYGAFEGVIPVFGEGEAPRHLVLTGPNGSGKSSILRGGSDALASWPRTPAARLREHQSELEKAQDHLDRVILTEQDRLRWLSIRENNRKLIDGARKNPIVNIAVRGDTTAINTLISIYLPASRRFSPSPVAGPSRLDLPVPRGADNLSKHFLQHLVNRRMEQALAREDDDDSAADTIQHWFGDLQGQLRKLLQLPELVLQFDRKRYGFDIEVADQPTPLADTLPDGFASILRIWSEILVACAAVEGKGEPRGFVLIDEPEVHLHPELQETLLPLLTQQFPSLQFIVATHSPIVMQSLANATIFDLERKEASRSEDWQGVRYGNVLKSHFGSPDEFDAATTATLERLHALHQLANPTPEELDEMRDLARPLAVRGHLYAIRVLTERGDD
jgi:hypothetical protein